MELIRTRWSRSLRLTVVIAVVAVTAAACGGSESASGDGNGSGGVESAEDVVSATLEIITTNIESAVGDSRTPDPVS